MDIYENVIQAGSVDSPMIGACTPEVSEYIAQNLSLIISDTVSGYTLVGSGFTDVHGVKFVHLQFMQEHTPVSLFIGCSKHVSMPGFEKELVAGQEYFKQVCDHCQMLYWKDGTTMILAVSGNKTMSLIGLRPVIQPI